MNDILKAVNNRISTLIEEMKVRSKELLSLERVKRMLPGSTSPTASTSGSGGAGTPDKPMSAPVARRHTKKHRTAAGLLKGRILTLLRMQRGTVKELVKQLEAAKFPFAHGTNHTGCVRACMVTAKGRGVLASTYVPGRGEVYSIARHTTTATVRYVDRTKPSTPTVQTRASQFGLTDKIIKVLAQAGVTGVGMTAMSIIRKMERNGFRFTAASPQKSVTGLLSSLLRKGMVRRRRPEGLAAFYYKIVPTTALLEAVKEED